MSADEAAFLAGIRADPDDAVRLVFADWLDEHDQPDRARFIRVQIALANLPEGDERGPALLREEQDLLGRHRSAWQTPSGPNVRSVFGRGFVEDVQFDVQWLTEYAPAVFAAHPIRSLSVTRSTQRAFLPETLLTCADLSRLHTLEIVGNLSAQHLHAVLTSPVLAHLSGIRLSCPQPLAIDGITSVFTDELPAITDLGLELSRLGHDAAESLVHWPGLSGLHRLDLSENEIGPDGVIALTAADCPRLVTLDLTQNELYQRGVTALASARRWPAVTSLDLTRNQCGDGGLRALLDAPLLEQTTHLGLGHNALGEASADLLADWPGLRRLRTLLLFGNPLPSDGLIRLARSPHWGTLHRLDLSHLRTERIDDAALEAWAASPAVRQLRALSLWGGAFGEAGLRALLESPNLPRALHLRIGRQQVSEAMFEALGERFDFVE